MQNEVKFAVDVTGTDTGTNFKGLFVAKPKLSMGQALREDEVRRDLLGKNPESASKYAQTVAAALAYLAVRITKAPQWWTDAANGVELEDENVLVEVHNRCADEISKLYRAVNEDAEKAREELKKQKDGEEAA